MTRAFKEIYMSVTEVRKQWSRVFKRIARGDVIIITRRGVPVAKLVPIPAEEREMQSMQA